MVDVFKGFVSGNLAYLTAWFLPTFASVGAFALFLLPHALQLKPYAWLASQSPTIAVTLIVGSALLLGVILATASTWLYRRLEGDVPNPLRTVLYWRMRQLRDQWRNDYAKAAEGSATKYRVGLLLERIQRIPTDEDQFLPTRLGNAMRAFETYASRQYYMDSQSLWEPLWAVTPQTLRDEHDRARGAVDFCVATVAVLALLAIVAFASGVAASIVDNSADVGLLTAGPLVPLILSRLFYNLGVRATDEWAFVVKGMVEVGRAPLAAALGLELPPTLAEERAMWDSVSLFVQELHKPGGAAYDWTGADSFDRFRARPPATSTAHLQPSP